MASAILPDSPYSQLTTEQTERLLRIWRARQAGILPAMADFDFLLDLLSVGRFKRGAL
ncbi:MAG: hypothetical protein ABSG52_14445 [Terriglobales bacterium]|jgi:hypothetical protein